MYYQSMKTTALQRAGSTIACLLLAAGSVWAQAPDTTRTKKAASWQFGETIGLGVALVNPDDDYYLPNDEVKFGSEVALHATRFWRRGNSALGLRLGLGLLGRNGRYTFGTEQVRRAETVGIIPIELVSRRYWRDSNWFSEASVGGYFGGLLSRTTYQLDPVTSMTRRNTDGWLYAMGGVIASFGVGYHKGRHYQQLGVRFSNDFTKPRKPDAGQLPNLQTGNISLCYSLSWGKS
jgi:hypothetical protein